MEGARKLLPLLPEPCRCMPAGADATVAAATAAAAAAEWPLRKPQSVRECFFASPPT